MDKKELFRAIDACEDRFIRGAAEISSLQG